MKHEEIDQIINDFNTKRQQEIKEDAAPHLVSLTHLENMAKAEMGFDSTSH